MRLIAALSTFISILIVSGSVVAENQKYIVVGTGGVTGVYYPAGGAICRMVNRNRSDHGMRCVVESTQGSVYNVTQVREQDIDLGVVQSDIHSHAYLGQHEFSAVGPDKSLRSLFSLHQELFTVLAREDAGISSLLDLKGKRINIGNRGSGQRATMDLFLDAMKWDMSVFLQTYDFPSADQSAALCANRFDALVFVAGHPNGTIKEATNDCNTRLINVSGAGIQTLIENFPYYQLDTIPAKMYRNNDGPIDTFGVSATFVSSDRLSDHAAYHIVKAVFENFETFKQLHPAFASLTRDSMLKNALTAPLHKGALKFYREAGLL